jgi:pyruvate dehydrogenase (quinone)
MRIARDQRTVTCVILPNDLQEEKAVETPPREHGTVHSGIGITGESLVPDASALQAAADVLNAGQRLAILVGAGALGATHEVIEVATCLGGGVAKALLGKAVVPDDLPFVTGAIGLLGTEPSWDLMQGCDTLLMVGTSFPYSEFLPKEGQARAVQIDLDNRRLGLRYPTEVNLVGDAKRTLEALLPLLHPKDDHAWRDQVEAGVKKWWNTMAERAASDATPINPQRVFHELSPRLPEEAIVCCDSGTSAVWYARDLKFRQGMMGSVSGGLASMGCALPYALAAKLAYPKRPVIAMLGDGAMQMLGLNALVTIADRWKQWADPRLVILVLNNGDLNMVTWEQRGTTGAPRYDTSQLLPGFPYADYAKLLGLGGVRVERPEQVTLALEEALGADRPMVLDLVVDANVLPIPPHVTPKQAKASLGALLKGDPEALAVAKATAKEWWASVRS